MVEHHIVAVKVEVRFFSPATFWRNGRRGRLKIYSWLKGSGFESQERQIYEEIEPDRRKLTSFSSL